MDILIGDSVYFKPVNCMLGDKPSSDRLLCFLEHFNNDKPITVTCPYNSHSFYSQDFDGENFRYNYAFIDSNRKVKE